jgi:hypothetical protein
MLYCGDEILIIVCFNSIYLCYLILGKLIQDYKSRLRYYAGSTSLPILSSLMALANFFSGGCCCIRLLQLDLRLPSLIGD